MKAAHLSLALSLLPTLLPTLSMYMYTPHLYIQTSPTSPHHHHSPMTAEAPPKPPLKAKVHVEAVQTVTPSRLPGPRSKPRRVAASPAALAEAMQSRACVVLIYRRPPEDANGWDLAGRLKESLNVTLSEMPVVAGRLRRADADDSGLEVRLTDSGVRLVQARAGAPMGEFLAGGEGSVRELAFWVDVDEKCFQYSPLVFVQLTIFEGEGYSIGVTGSLLLTDPSHLSRFIKTWSEVHESMRFSASSIFHLSKFRRPNTAPLYTSTVELHRRRRTLFFASDDPQLRQPDDPLGRPFTLFLNDPSGNVKIDSCEGASPEGRGTEAVNWAEHVRLDGVGFEKGLRPAHAFCFLESNAEQGMAVLMPPAADGFAGAVAIGVVAPEVAVET